MPISVFPQHNEDATKEPMFFGNGVNVARYDQQRYPKFEQLIEKQLSFFWRPEEVDISNDRTQFQQLLPHEKHVFLANLRYQTLLDSVQGRSPNLAFLPITSLPELETWLETWSFSETIHSRSYTHIIRNVVNDPSDVFDQIMLDKEILSRATSVTKHYDALIEHCNVFGLLGWGVHTLPNGKTYDCTSRNLKKLLFLAVVSVNILEGVRFYVSFMCSWSFAERGIMEGNAKIIKLIAQDEALHLVGTQEMLRILMSGEDWNDPELYEVCQECIPLMIEMFREAAQQEKDWADYLFKDGAIIGLNAKILGDYIEYITNVRMRALKLDEIFPKRENPLPWSMPYLKSDIVQVAPQETEIDSYLSGQIDTEVNIKELAKIEL